jgi:hypothetical protein
VSAKCSKACLTSLHAAAALVYLLSLCICGNRCGYKQDFLITCTIRHSHSRSFSLALHHHCIAACSHNIYLSIGLVALGGRLLGVNTSLVHEVRDRLLQIIDAVAHLVDASDNGSAHLVKSVLLSKQRRERLQSKLNGGNRR